MNNLTDLNKKSVNSPNLPQGFHARVRFTITDNITNPTLFKEYGEWSSIGGVLFDKVNQPSPSKGSNSLNFAKPLFPWIKSLPVETELIYIIPLPSPNVQSDLGSIVYYYITPINLWASNHHNALPDPINAQNPNKDYTQTQAGNINRGNNNTDTRLGETFTESENVKPTQLYEGDILFEGRFGQSIRFGSTVKNAALPNKWSSNGKNGSPITIITNGQTPDQKEAYIPQLEKINTDPSSIYITQDQVLEEFNPSSDSYKSYDSPPEKANKFKKSQILLNSDRLFFNAKADSIFLSSKKSINLNSRDSINIDTTKMVVDAKKILLGNKNANQPAILGNTFFNDLQSLFTSLAGLLISLQTPIGSGVPFAPNPSIAPPASQTLTEVQRMLSRLESYKSKTVSLAR